MRDPWGLNERLFALYFPPLMALAENAGQRETRRELVGQARGHTLELGAGSGVNLAHYTEAVSELVLSEPSPHMREHLQAAIAQTPPRAGSVTLVDCTGESIPFPDGHFDTVVATYILCTTPDPERALREIHRVLAPGGRYLFLEHVHAGEGTLLGRVQDLVEVPHRYIAAGCYPNRRTEALLRRSPLHLTELIRGRQPRAPATVRPTIRGAAVRDAGEAAGSAAQDV